jgi:tripartite-type tricarboxylate transporter receptor subunit TctC
MPIKIGRRFLGSGVFAFAISAALTQAAPAQSWPARPIRLVVPFPPGGGVDAVGRILAEPLSQALGQAVIVENRAGAGGAIGVDSVAKAPPDGYTLSMVSAGNMTAGPVVRRTPYDPTTLGFVTMVCQSPLLLVARNTLQARDLAAFVDLVRQQPDLIRFASGGVGTATHLAGELMNLRLGARMLHIPYRGTAPALTDLVAGNADVFFSDSSAWPMVQQGQMRLLGVTTAARWTTSPDTPAINSLVPDFDISNWYGVIAPPETPLAIRERLAAEIFRILGRVEIREMLGRIGFEPAPMAPADFGAFVRSETETWRAVVKAANIQPE